MHRLAGTLLAVILVAGITAQATAQSSPAGPPFPDPVDGVRVHDYANVLAAETVESVEATIAAIEKRTGAQVVAYTQIKPESDTVEEAEADAAALIDQWGVGRYWIDDGLAILFDLQEDTCHGQVQLYAGPGYRLLYLDNEARQAIFEEVMLPHLRGCDFDMALLAAIAEIHNS